MSTLVMQPSRNGGPGAEDRQSPRSVLLNLTGIDVSDEQDEMLEKCRTYVSSLLVGVSQQEIANTLGHVCHETAGHDDVMLGLTAKILLEPNAARMGFLNLSLLNRDGFALVVRQLEIVVLQKFSKLNEQPRQQLIWLIGEMVKTGGKGVPGCDKLVLALLRNVEGGNLDNSNIWLAENVLNLLQDNRAWLDENKVVLCTALYTYLRLLADHSSSAVRNLMMAEVDFCISLLRTQFADCMALGRDLVRLLQALGRVPEFNQLWTDMLHNPPSLSPHFTGMQQLLELRTSRRYIASRLTPDMETKLNFLLSKVGMGQQKRHQEWFHNQFLSSADRQTLIPDLVRYICCVVHPTNEILASNIVPRWALIGWLLLSCQSNVTASNTKLVLFYDWLFYNSASPEENIMNVEPGLLVMHQSLAKHPQMTATLLDFLCRIASEFYPPMRETMLTSVTAAFQDCLDKGVIQNLSMLFGDSRIDTELRRLVHESFPKFAVAAPAAPTEGSSGTGDSGGRTASDNGESPAQRHATNTADTQSGAGRDQDSAALPGPGGQKYNFSETPASRLSESDTSTVHPAEDLEETTEEAIFSDDEEDGQKEGLLSDVVAKVPVLMVDSLTPDLRKAMVALSEATEVLERCQHVHTVLQAYVKQATPSDLTADHAASSLSSCLRTDFSNACCESDPEQEDELPPALFRHCAAMADTASAATIWRLLSAVQQYFPSVGYRLLYYLHMTKSSFDVYRQCAHCFPELDLLSCLERDLKLCQEEDPVTFYALIPCIFTVFAEVTVGSSILIYLLVSSIDSVQLHELICDVMLGKFQIFGYSGLLDVIQATLEWEMFEQFFVWQLLAAEGCSLKELLPLLSELDPNINAEPMTGLLFIFKQSTPDLLAAAALLRCPSDEHHIAPCVLQHWAKRQPLALASLFTELLRGAQSGEEFVKVGVDELRRHLQLLASLLPENNSVLTNPTLRQVLEDQYNEADGAAVEPGYTSPTASGKRRNSAEYHEAAMKRPRPSL